MSAFFTTGRVLDLLIVVLLIITVLRYLRSGFVAGLLSFVGSLASVGAAIWCAKALSPTMFTRLFEENLISRTAGVIEHEQGVLTTSEVLNRLAGFLPQNIIDTFLGQAGTASYDLAQPGIVQRIVTEVVQPLLLPVISVLVFFVVFVVCRILINFLVAALKNINRIPLVGTANRLLGMASGLLVGLLYGYLLVCGAWALAVITGGEVAALSPQAFSQSFFYGLFSGILPFG